MKTPKEPESMLCAPCSFSFLSLSEACAGAKNARAMITKKKDLISRADNATGDSPVLNSSSNSLEEGPIHNLKYKSSVLTPKSAARMSSVIAYVLGQLQCALDFLTDAGRVFARSLDDHICLTVEGKSLFVKTRELLKVTA